MNEASVQVYARLAGFLYLAVMGAFIAPYVMLQGLAVAGDFAATAENVGAAELTYRVALAIQVLGCIGIVLLSGALYAVLRHVDADLALIGLLWRAGEAIVLALGVVIRFGVLNNYLAVAAGGDVAAREALHGALSSAVGASSYVAFLFLAVGSLSFFTLFFRSRLVPRLLSGFALLAALLVAGLAIAALLAPTAVSALGLIGMAPMFLAEVSLGLWLLVGGVSVKHLGALQKIT